MMKEPKKTPVSEAQKETDALPPGKAEALKIGADAEHETGARREKLTRRASQAAQDSDGAKRAR